MALGQAQANETVNYLGKLSGNSLISGRCLPPDGIPQVAEHQTSTPPSLLYEQPFIGIQKGWRRAVTDKGGKRHGKLDG